MTGLTHGDLSQMLDIPLPVVEKSSNSVSSDNKIDALLHRLDNLNGAKCTQWLLESLKVHVRYVSEDLAAITLSEGMPKDSQLNVTRFFWTGILAISEVYKNKKSVFKCLVTILTKIHGTTNLLRRAKPGVNDVTRVDKLNTTLIRLLSRAVPQRFLFVFRRSVHPNEILHDPQVQSGLDDLTHCVREVQGIELPSETLSHE
ncbi:hypothetical protein DL96DRAFT_1824855 [Flagelloscypha sp. PMI_526]|nr:hypothetical protein DL96DRAFT_1824855 [Flagelloscypha sp. PMI_526]